MKLLAVVAVVAPVSVSLNVKLTVDPTVETAGVAGVPEYGLARPEPVVIT